MAGTYGEPGKNTFALTGISGVLSPVVNDTSGIVQIYRQGALNRYQSLGTYNPNTKKFTPDPNANLTTQEIRSFSTTANIDTIKNASSLTVSRGVISAGGTPEEANAKSTQLSSPNSPTQTEDQEIPGIVQGYSDVIGGNEAIAGIGLEEALRYPEDLNGSQQDYIIFTMVETSQRALGEGSAGPFSIGARPKPTTDQSKGQVILPIQSGILDTNTVGWGPDELDPLSIAGAKIFKDAVQNGMGTLGGNAKGILEQIRDNAPGAKDAVTYEMMAQALNKPANALLARGTGAIINPNVELLFNGVSLRPFSFNFKMSARTEKEAKIIKKIIYFFKKGMAAKQTKSSFFLKTPYTFLIEYKHKNQTHPGMNLIKQCALQNFGVNYTSDGQYSVHSDGNLTSYEISMQFTELDPLYFDDYDGKHPIGY
jgi:hypothetical protein